MASINQHVFYALVVVVVFLFISSHARPVTDEDWPSDDDVERILHSPVIEAHVRSYARKRHAEIRLSSEIGRRMAELKRIQALNQLMADLDTSKVYTVQNNSAAADKEDTRERRSRHQQRRKLNNHEGCHRSGLKNKDNQEKNKDKPRYGSTRDKVYPTAPTNREIAPQLLRQLNGQTLSGGVKMRIVTGSQTHRAPPTAHQFKKYIENTKNAVAAAKTCRDMQEMISRGNMRLRIRCQSTTNLRPQHRHN